MEASAMFLLEREHRVHDTDSLLHEFLHVFHKSCVIRVYQLIAYVKNQEVCLPLYRRMLQMDKDGKKLVAEFVYWACRMTKFLLDRFFFFEAFESQSQMGKEALCPNLNIFGFLSCRYAYAHDKNLKNIRKDFVC